VKFTQKRLQDPAKQFYGRRTQPGCSQVTPFTRRISGLETCLSARLLQRNTRGIALTDLGSRYYQHGQAVIAAAEAAALPAFLERYPKVNIESDSPIVASTC